MVFKALQPLNAPSPIAVTLSGMVIVVSDEQLMKVFVFISLTVSGMFIVSSERQF